MGREIRRVPPGWQHPKIGDLYEEGYEPRHYSGRRESYHPQYDKNYDDAASEWMEECIKWANGDVSDDVRKWREKYPYYWEWNGDPPKREYYRTGKWAFKPEEATWYMMYEDTSEGTPKSPACATPEEVARYCADNGVSSFGGMTATYEQWLSVACGRWAPSMVISGGKMMSGVEATEVLAIPATPAKSKEEE